METSPSSSTVATTHISRGALLLWRDLPSNFTYEFPTTILKHEEPLRIPSLVRAHYYSAHGTTKKDEKNSLLAWYEVDSLNALPAAQIDMEEVFENLFDDDSSAASNENRVMHTTSVICRVNAAKKPQTPLSNEASAGVIAMIFIPPGAEEPERLHETVDTVFDHQRDLHPELHAYHLLIPCDAAGPSNGIRLEDVGDEVLFILLLEFLPPPGMPTLQQSLEDAAMGAARMISHVLATRAAPDAIFHSGLLADMRPRIFRKHNSKS